MSDDKELPLRLKAYTDLKVENARRQRQINALKSVLNSVVAWNVREFGVTACQDLLNELNHKDLCWQKEE